jgi:hypothetical protein
MLSVAQVQAVPFHCSFWLLVHVGMLPRLPAPTNSWLVVTRPLTVTLLPKVAASVTFRVLPNVVAPVTLRVF